MVAPFTDVVDELFTYGHIGQAYAFSVGDDRDESIDFALLGDPELRMWDDVPDTMSAPYLNPTTISTFGSQRSPWGPWTA